MLAVLAAGLRTAVATVPPGVVAGLPRTFPAARASLPGVVAGRLGLLPGVVTGGLGLGLGVVARCLGIGGAGSAGSVAARCLALPVHVPRGPGQFLTQAADCLPDILGRSEEHTSE